MHGDSEKDEGASRAPGLPLPPGGSPLRVDPRRLRPTPGTQGSMRSVPMPAPSGGSLPIVEETSAGGVVARPPKSGEMEPHIAVIVRRNRAGRIEWCLPKGHLEGDETPQQAAIREISEETGILGQIRRPLGIIDYWFTGDTRRVHKMVHHYLLTMTGGYLTVENDPDQEADDAIWVPISGLAARLSYPNEQRLAVVARQMLESDESLVVPEGEDSEDSEEGAEAAPTGALRAGETR